MKTKTKKTPKTTAKAKVTRITIARLFNLGRYEHIRFEFAAEVPDGVSAAETLLELGAITGRLQPISKPCGYEEAKKVINKVSDQLTESEKAQVERYAELVKDYEGSKALRLAAIKRLDELGGTSKHTDAKLSWGDEEDLF